MKHRSNSLVLSSLLGKMILLLATFTFSLGTVKAQYTNGNLGTGTTTMSGVAAPSGSQWHEMQGSATQSNVAIAFDNSPVLGNSRVADDFTVPGGVQWNITKMTFYAVVLPPPPGTSPVTAVRIIIRDASPVGTSNIIYGDLTTNRLSSTSFASIYAAANTQVPPPGTPPNQNFVVWKVEANINTTLPPGNYWVEWQTVGAPGQRVFALMSQPLGARTLPGYNAVSTFNGGPWQPTLDLGAPASAPDVPVDFCFGVDYTTSPCLSPTSSILSQVGGPMVTTTLINQNFDVAIPLPAGWVMQNLSNPIGPFNWRQGPYSGIGLPANSGAANSYIASTWSSTTTTGVGTVSNWLFAPNITMKNGDELSFWTRTLDGAFPDRLEVRMSTNGSSTNVGATEFSVGDFSTVLLDINPNYTSTGYPTAWTKYTITLSGLPVAGVSGRLAFRHFVTNGGGNGTNSEIVAIDDVLYQNFSPGPITTCTGSTANLKVDITGGNAPYTVVINRVPGGNFTINNYVSGTNIPVTPAVTTTYSLVSVTGCGVGTGNSGTPTITVLPATVPGLIINDDPPGPLCAGNPKLLTVVGAPVSTTFSSGPAPNNIPCTGSGSTTNPGPACVYPVNLNVTGLPTTGVTVKSVTVSGLNHTYMSDVNMVLQSPTGQNVIILADAGRDGNFVNHTLTFDDAAPLALNNAVGGTNPPASGTTWKCTNLIDFLFPGSEPDNWPAPGPGTAPTSTTLSTFTGDPNGVWKLYIADDAGGDVGSLTGGYSITFNTASAPLNGWTFYWTPASGLNATTGNPVAASPTSTTTYTVLGTAPGGCQTTANITINVNQLPAVTTQPSNATICDGASASFTVAGTGAGLTYQWQVSTSGAGGPWVNLTNTAPYSGVNTATLTINPAVFSMNGYRYRCALGGSCQPVANSIGAILTVNALPNVSVTPTTACGGVPGTNGLLLTASGASTYTWSPVTGLFTNATATIPYAGSNTSTVYAAPTTFTTYTVTGTTAGTGCSNTATAIVNYTPPAPTITPSSVTMCLGDPAVRLTSSTAQTITSSFSSGTVNVAVPDNTVTGATSTIAVSGIPANATITGMAVRLNMSHTYPGDMIFNLKPPTGTSILNLYKYAGGAFTGPASGVPTWGWYNAQISSIGTTAFNSVASAPFTYNTPPVWRADLLNTAVAGVTVQNPTGYISNAANWNAIFPSPATGANGTWTLAMADGGPGDLGTLASWTLEITYVLGVPGTPAVWTPNGPGSGLFNDAAATIPYTGTPRDTVWTRPTPSGIYNYQATVQSLPLSGTIALPAQSSTLTGNVRGYWFTAPSSFTMTSVEVPTTASSGPQSIAVVRFNGATPPPVFPTTTNAFTQLFLTQNNPSAGPIPVNIPINAGDVIGILGYRSNVNSYTTNGPISTTINGIPVQLTRLGMQFPLTTTAPQQIWQEPAFQISRVFFTYGLPVPQCTSPARNVTVTVNQPTTVTTQPVNQVICTDKVATYSVTAAGSGPFTYQWQVSTNTGNTWSNIANGGVYAGASSSTLTITAPPVSMSGYFYRCIVSGAAPCVSAISFQATLTVNPLPTVVISAVPYTRLFPGLRTTLSSTVSPAAAAQYTWLRNGVAVSGATGASLNVDVDGQGLYTLRVTDVNGCTNTSNTISIQDSASGQCFLYPNPTSGQFQVRYYSVANNVLPRSVTVYNANGERVLAKFFTVGRPYDRMDIDLRKNGKGLYWVEIGDANGNRLTMCRVVVQ